MLSGRSVNAEEDTKWPNSTMLSIPNLRLKANGETVGSRKHALRKHENSLNKMPKKYGHLI